MKPKAITILGLASVLSLAAAACGSDDEPASTNAPEESVTTEVTDETATTDASDESATTDAADVDTSDPFVIGVATSMSGNYEFLGNPTELGVQAAVEVLNQRGGVQGREVTYVLCDDETNPETARACYEKLVDNDGADVLVGFPLGAATEAVAPLVAEDEMPLWILGGSYGGRSLDGQEYMFAGLPVTEDVLDAVFSWGADQGYEDAWILTTEDITGEPCREFGGMDDEARHGIEVLGTTTMQSSAQTAAPQVAEISADADFTFICVSGGAGIVAAVAYEQSGLEAPAVAIHSQSVGFIAGAMADKVSDDTLYVASFCTLGVATGELTDDYTCYESAQEFVDTLATISPDAEADSLTAHAYDGALLLATAANETDGSGPAIVAYMEGLEEFPGAMGMYTFTDTIRRGLGSDQVLLGVYRGNVWEFSDALNLPKS